MVMGSLERLDPPQTLGKLTLLARLGEGGMATVYVAAMGQGSLARLCAVKLLRAGIPDHDYRTRFVDEAKVVVRLHHNNLVDVREAGEHEGQLFIVMELCEGRDLADVWDRCAEVGQAFPVPVAVYIVREALRGLHYAHTFPGLALVHRDISPSNILIDWAGAVRVADFGLATSAIKATATMPGMVFGKVGYMAPEQARRGDLDARADVYSCGVVLWELLTGRPLRETGIDARAIGRFTANPASSFSRRVDPELDAIVTKALQTAPNDRFAGAAEFMRALSEWLANRAPTLNQESMAEFMEGLFGDAMVRDHAAYGSLLENLNLANTGVYARVGLSSPEGDEPPAGQAPDSEAIAPGTVVASRYRIEQALGRGGMGTVYLAEHVTVGRKVAVKVLTKEWSRHEIVARRFREEARAASAAGHPNIVEVFDAGTLPDGRLFLVMEYLVGHSLYHEIVDEGPLPWLRATHIAREVARAVAAAHGVGIIHRDLKPDNVMIVQRGDATVIKVLDFGISTTAERDEEQRRLTLPGHALGTPEYMAPEQAKGSPPTERVDIYALGVILYEMLVGEPPFRSDNMIEVLTRKTTEAAPVLDAMRNDLPHGLVSLVMDCLATDPTERPDTMAQVIDRLDAAEFEGPPDRALVPFAGTADSNQAMTVLRVGPPSIEARPRRRALVWGGGALALALVAVIGAVVGQLASRGQDSADGVGAAAMAQQSQRPSVGTQAPGRDELSALSGELMPEGSSRVPDTDRRADSVAEKPSSATGAIEDGAAEQGEAAKPAAPPPKTTSTRRRTRRASTAASAASTKHRGRDSGASPATGSIESESCRAKRSAAERARAARDWSGVLAQMTERSCWSGPYQATALKLRMKALYERRRFSECATLGAKSSIPEVQTMAAACAERARNE